jgi:hypothetical protein
MATNRPVKIGNAEYSSSNLVRQPHRFKREHLTQPDRALLCASPAALAGDGNQLAELWRRRCKLVGGLVSIAQFDGTVRKLLLELQPRRERFYKHAIFRFRYSVDFDDVTFGERVIGEFVLHENHRSPRQPTHSNSKIGKRLECLEI